MSSPVLSQEVSLGRDSGVPAPPTIPLRVLLVEDSLEDSELVLRELKRSGFHLYSHRVASETELLEALQSQWDIVLTDHSMPAFSSTDVLQILRHIESEVPCIMVSGSIGEEAAVHALRSGARDYVSKDRLTRLGPAIERELAEAVARRAQREASEALHESQERLRALTENAFDLIAEIDEEGNFTYLSPNHERLVGYRAGQLLGRPLTSHLHQADQAKVRSLCAEAARSGRDARFEYRYLHAGGEERWFESTVRPITTAAGERHIVMVSRDTTSRKRLEEEMVALISLAKSINTRHDLETIVQEIATHMQPLLPFESLAISLWSQDALLSVVRHGKAGILVIPGNLSRQSAPEHPVWKALDEGTNLVVHEWAETGGAPQPLSFLGIPLRADGQTLGLLHFKSSRPAAFDEAHMRLATLVGEQIAVALHEAQLLTQARTAEEKFRTLVSRVNAIVWELDWEARKFKFVSPQAQKWLGYPVEAWLDEREFWLRCIHPEDREAVVAQFHQAMDVGGAHQLEYRVFAEDGKQYWLRDLLSIEHLEGETPRIRGIMFDVTDRKEMETQLQLRERAMEGTRTGIIITDAKKHGHPIVYANPAFERLTGYREEEVLGCHLGFLAGPETDNHAMRELVAALNEHREGQVTLKIYRKDGTTTWNELHVSPVHAARSAANAQPEVTHFIWVQTDITERKEADEALQQSNAVLRATQEAAADGICLVDDNGTVVSINGRFAEMWGISPDQVQHVRDNNQFMAEVLAKLTDPDEFIDKIDYLFDNPHDSTRDEIMLLDGRTFERHSAPARADRGHNSEDNSSYGRVWCFSDLTERKQYEQQLAHQAFHDPVTLLPNRALLMERLKLSVARDVRSQKGTAVLFLDLDHFKVVNDSLGHEKGDLLLVEVGRRLQSCLRPGDTAARFGGDEFAILLEEITGTHDATAVAERIGHSLQRPFELDGRSLNVAASIGIVISSGGQDRPEDLLRKADVAMYRAKNNGRAQYEVFDNKVSSLALERLQLEIDLRQSIKQHELRLHYQPLVSLETGRIVGMESLLRWDHPERGLLPPLEFIGLAEETRMVIPIGMWVLREACHQLREWQREFPSSPPLEMSVNLSVKQFQSPHLAEDIARVLHESGLPPHSLELEIVESTVMEDAEATTAQLEALKELGVKLAVDDFGTGYSSLSYLERFPLDTLKIDRTFVNRLRNAGDGTAVVRAITTLGQSLGMRVTAEGIETNEQLTHLRQLGCRIGQGFLFARPLDAAAMTALLREDPEFFDCGIDSGLRISDFGLVP